jgi:chromosome segregation ATPase
MSDIVERLREGVFGGDETKTDAVIHSHMQAGADEIERLRAERDAAVKVRYEAIQQMKAAKAEREEAIQRGDDWCDQAQKLRAERDMWRAENAKKVTACEQMGARITTLEAERDEAQAEANAGRQAEHDADVERRAVESERDRLRAAQAAIHALSQRPPGGWLPGEHFQALNKIAALAALKETGHE